MHTIFLEKPVKTPLPNTWNRTVTPYVTVTGGRITLELDIVADKDKELIIVEVKTRSNTDYIEPQDAVNWQKIRRIGRSGRCLYQALLLGMAPVRFEIITAVGEPGAFRIEHLKEAFLSADVLRVEN